MNKVISILVFGAALVWTWNKVHTAQPVNFETHSGIQIRLAELIKETLQQKFPDAGDVRINRIWTEALNENEIKAVFAYEFQQPLSEGESVRQSIAGEAFLKRTAEGSDEWSLERVTAGSNEISFSEGTVVIPESEETTEQPQQTTVEAKPVSEGDSVQQGETPKPHERQQNRERSMESGN